MLLLRSLKRLKQVAQDNGSKIKLIELKAG